MIGRFRLESLSLVKAFERAPRSGNVDLVGDDARHGRLDRFQIAGVVRNLIQFEQSVVARHHLVGFLSVLPNEPSPRRIVEREAFRHGNAVERLGYQLRSVGRFHTIDDIPREVEVLFVQRAVVQQHDRFQNRARRHAPVNACPLDLPDGRNLRQQMIGQTYRPVERFLVARQVVVGEQTEHGVLAAPHVPVGQLGLRRVVADVSVGLLGGEQRFDSALYFAQQLGIFVVTVGCDGSESPFTPEFGLPQAGFRLPAHRSDQQIGVFAAYADPDTSVDPVAQIAVHMRLYPRNGNFRFFLRGFRGGRRSGDNKTAKDRGGQQLFFHDRSGCEMFDSNDKDSEKIDVSRFGRTTPKQAAVFAAACLEKIHRRRAYMKAFTSVTSSPSNRFSTRWANVESCWE